MPTTRDGHRNREMWIRVLERQTSAGLEVQARSARASANDRVRIRSFQLRPSTIHETMRLQIALTMPADVDAEVEDWLRQACEENS